MGKGAKRRELKSELSGLQAVFLKRVQEEMERQGLLNKDGEPNSNALAKRNGAPPQTTINDALRGANPRLGTVQKFADALEVSAVSLLTELTTKDGVVYILPTYPPVFGGKPPENKQRDRKRSKG